MDSLLLWTLTISLMFTGGQCYSESTSCSSVNGRMVCESQKGAGNTAGSSASAQTGQGRSYQDANAMIGNSNTGQSSASRTAVGNMPPGGFGGFGPGAGAFAGGFSFPFEAPPTFGGGFDSPAGTSARDTGTGSTCFTGTSGSDGTAAGGAFTGSGGFAGPGDSGVFVGGGFAFPFGAPPTFFGSSASPAGTSASDSANTRTGSTYFTGTSGSDGIGASGAFVGTGVLGGTAGGGFAGSGDSGEFVGGGFAFPFGAPTFGGGSASPASTSASDSANTGTSSTSFTGTSGSDGTGAGGAFAGGFAGSGGFVGTSAGGFAGSGDSGVFVGGGAFPGIPAFGTGGGVFVGNPQAMFAPGFPFNFAFGGGFPFGRR